MIKNVIKKYNNFPLQIKASFWYFICSFFQKGISVITTPIFTRLMSTDEYGQYGIFTSWQSIVAIFITLRLYYGVYGQGLIKFDKERTVFSSSLQGLVVTMTFLGTIIYLFFHNFFNSLFSLNTVQVIMMLIMTWTEAVYCFWAAEQRVELNYKRLVLLTVAVSFFKPVIGIILVLISQEKVTARIIGIVFVELFAYVGLFVSQMKRGKVFFSKKFWSYALKFNLPLIPHYLSQTVLNSFDRIMISRMIDESSAGIYSLAYSISMLMLLFNTALSQTLSPWILQKIKDNKISDTSIITYISLCFVAFANLLLIAFAPEIVAIFAPESYRTAIWVIPPIAMSVYFIFAYTLFSNIEFYFEKTKMIMLSSTIAAVVNIGLNYFFIRRFGFIAAGYTTLICYIIYAVVHYIFMTKLCKEYISQQVPYKPKILLFISIVFISAGFIMLTVYHLWYIKYIIILIFALLVFINRNTLSFEIKNILDSRRKLQ